MLVVTVRISVEKEHVAAFSDSVKRQAKLSLSLEKGCQRFDVVANLEKPHRILLYEVYADEAAFQAHLRTPHFLAFRDEIKSWIKYATVERWSVLWT